MKVKPIVFFLLLLFLVSFSGAATEIIDGQLRLVLHENSGRFSLYSLEGGKSKGEALFADEDPRTSFLSVMINDRSYKMGDTSAFKTSLRGDTSSPSFVFESAFMTITQNFSFIKSQNSGETRAVRITITLENRGDKQISTGARFLLDTKLGEGFLINPFTTNRRTINTETLLSRLDGDRFWTDSNDKVSLSGSFITGSASDPDSIYFANWKKLTDVTWKASYQAGRNFSSPPYSIRDTAVCYYFEPAQLSRGEKRSFAFSLGLNGDALISAVSVPGPADSGSRAMLDLEGFTNDSMEQELDLALLRELVAQIEAHIALGVATEEEMADLEFALNKLRAKYGSQ